MATKSKLWFPQKSFCRALLLWEALYKCSKTINTIQYDHSSFICMKQQQHNSVLKEYWLVTHRKYLSIIRLNSGASAGFAGAEVKSLLTLSVA